MTVEGSAGFAPEAGRSKRRRYAFAFLAAWTFRVAAGAVVALPLIRLFDARLRHVPHGDRDLFDDGGALLFETLWHAVGGLGVVVKNAGVAGLVAALLSLLPLAFLVSALTEKETFLVTAVLRRAFRALPTFVALGGAGAAAEAVLFVMVVAAGAALGLSFETPRQATVALAGYALALLPLVAAALIRDVAYVAAGAHDARFYDAVTRALRVLRRRPLAALAWRAAAMALSLLAFGVGALSPFVIGLSSTPQWVTVACLQQLAVAVSVAIDVAYFECLVRVDRTV